MSALDSEAPVATRRPRTLARPFAFALLAAATFATHMPARSARAQAVAGAEPHGFALNWVRGPGAEACISSSELAARIAQLIGPVFREPDLADRAIEGLITAHGARPGFSVRLRMVDRAGAAVGERSFASDAAECGALTDSVLLVVALMIDPSAGDRGLPAELLGLLADDAAPGAALLAELERERAQRERAAQPLAVTVAQPAAEPAAQRAPASVPPAATRVSAARPHSALPPGPPHQLQLELALTPALSYRLQPEVEPGIGAHARLITAWPVSFELGFSYWLPSEVELTQAPPGSAVDFNAAVTTLSACLPVVRAKPIAAFACAGAAVAVRWLETTALLGRS